MAVHGCGSRSIQGSCLIDPRYLQHPGGIDPDEALERTNRKLSGSVRNPAIAGFIQRFQFLEREGAKDGKKMGEMTLEEMDVYWERAKEV